MNSSNGSWLLPEDILFFICSEYYDFATFTSWDLTCKAINKRIKSQLKYMYYYQGEVVPVEKYYTAISDTITAFSNNKLVCTGKPLEHLFYRVLVFPSVNEHIYSLSHVLHCKVNVGDQRVEHKPYLELSIRTFDGTRITVYLANESVCYHCDTGNTRHVKFEYDGVNYYIQSELLKVEILLDITTYIPPRLNS